MKVVGLLSGGKDSCFNLCHCARNGHEIVALATLAPPEGKDELDSYMYQTVGHDAVHLVAQAMELPLYRRTIKGRPLQTGSSFGVRKLQEALPNSHDGKLDQPSASEAEIDDIELDDETSDLYHLLLNVKLHHPDVKGVAVGAILSNYQRTRVETICAHPNLDLQPLSYLWQREQSSLLSEMISSGVEAILIKVAGIGLEERDLGKTLAQMQRKLEKLKDMYGAHPCGEGGEYETLTLDCPLFKKRIRIDEPETIVHSSSGFASVAYLRIHKASLVERASECVTMDQIDLPEPLDLQSQAVKLKAQEALSGALKGRTNAAGVVKRKLSLRSGRAVPALQQGRIRRQDRWAAFTTSEHQTIQDAFAEVRTFLQSHSLCFPHIQHLNLFLPSQSQFASANAIYKTQFGVEPPSRATVALPHLGSSGGSITLDGWAYDDGSTYEQNPAGHSLQLESGDRSHARQSLHVQSLSYWASANIGPYSQSVRCDTRITIAGQIGLLPVDLSLPIEQEIQMALSLQHARRIWQALCEERARKGKGWIEGGVCWLAAAEDESDAEGRQKSDAKLLEAAMAAWGIQGASPSTNGDDVDENDGEGGDALSWLLGEKSPSPPPSAHSLPMLYVQLPPSCLPRGACVEWQLTGCDGRRAQQSGAELHEDEEDDDDQGEAPLAIPSRYAFRLTCASGERFEGLHHQITSPKGGSSMGLVCLRSASTSRNASHDEEREKKREEQDDDQTVLAEVKRRLTGSMSLKIFTLYDNRDDDDSDAPADRPAAPSTNEEAYLWLDVLLTAGTETLEEHEREHRREEEEGPAISVISALALSTKSVDGETKAATSSNSGSGSGSGSGSVAGPVAETWQCVFMWQDIS